MAEGTQHSKKPNNGGKMNPSPNPPQQISHKPLGEPPPDSMAISPDQTERSASDTQTGMELHLSGPQHAQVLQAVFEQNQIGVAILGLDGKIQHVNRALADLMYYKQEELTGRTLETLVRGVEPARNSHGGAEALPGERRAAPAVNQMVRKSGDTISCLIDSHAIRDGKGKISHFLVFIADARSRKDAEERNRFERGLFQSQSFQILGMLAAGVAHDFNNALEVIMGFASLARIRLSAADPLHEPLKIIEESAKGAADLVRQLLDVSKDKPEEERDIEAGDLINSVIAIISRTFDRKIRIEHRIDPQLPRIRGIRNRLEQAILNLCINARDALCEGGSLTLEATSQVLSPDDSRLPRSNEPGNYVRISVRDSGVGMTTEIMEQIFVPLFTTKGPGQGSGLGLAMVDRIIKEARGFISVSSKAGEGSEFSLYLPAVLSEGPRAVHPGPSQLMSGRGRVLVVDDEPRVLEFLEKGLTRLGYDVVPAESGNQACEIYSRQSHEINCVLLDLIMPGMSGLETYGRLLDINPLVRVILSSGYSSGRIKREAVEVGSPEFLEKPYTLEELSQALQKIQQN
jgi:PAS domain S-box-containing protein